MSSFEQLNGILERIMRKEESNQNILLTRDMIDQKLYVFRLLHSFQGDEMKITRGRERF